MNGTCCMRPGPLVLAARARFRALSDTDPTLAPGKGLAHS